ncbi:MAG: serine/threonine protein kinase [Gemmataceae bacterium]|nr:serine/threonine protein kinase [Gemmataceae bacterium]MCI0740797.1 serine/threonine protein kinase [Gemmataceae bacterium]
MGESTTARNTETTFGGAAPNTPTQETVGQYLLVEKLGEGGMGAVYKAVHTQLQKNFAIKLLSAQRLPDPSVIQRFRQERIAVGKLDHPNIVRATDAGEFQGHYFLVMEYVEGQDLNKIVKERGKLPVAEACAIIRQAAEGLQYIHEQNLVHRDIKPSNLMLTATGQVKILDLGLALFPRQATLDEDELTMTGQVMGTWDYISPEQALDTHSVDIRADIYSLGCTFFKLLTGRAPFACAPYDSNREKIRAHLEIAPPKLDTLQPDVPAAIQLVLDRMLAKDPMYRYQSPREVAEALAAFADSDNLSKLVTVRTGPVPGKSSSATVARAPATTGTGWTAGQRWLALVFLALVIGGIGLGLFFALRPPSDDGKNQPRADKPEVGKWFRLFRTAPKRLIWSPNIPQPHWDENREEITCPPARDYGILGLGEVGAGDYFRFSVSIEQAPWSGAVGVVFGFQDSTDQGKPLTKYQGVGLEPPAPGAAHYVTRFSRTETINAKGKKTGQTSVLAKQTVPRPSLPEETLDIEVRGQRLFKVFWAGQELTDLTTEELNAGFTDDDHRGAFGIYVVNYTAIFRDGRLMLLER